MKIKRHCGTSAPGGTSAYKSAEQQTESERSIDRTTFRLVCAYLPKQKPDWELVATAYNSTRKSQWKDRDAASLKRKFRGMSASRMLTNSPQLSHQAKASSGDKCKSHQALDLPKKCQPDSAQDGQARRQQKELQAKGDKTLEETPTTLQKSVWGGHQLDLQ
ncbi:hypothetical protein PI124_g10100 [Phytophthora idaei]|nr:hypothetical protein PI124_g10100 [Phytophthora idaei]